MRETTCANESNCAIATLVKRFMALHNTHLTTTHDSKQHGTMCALSGHRGARVSFNVNQVSRFPPPAKSRTPFAHRAYRHWASLAIAAYLMTGCGSDVTSDAENPNACDDIHCDAPRTCVAYYGVAGTSGPLFTSCEIPCLDSPDVCPEGTICTTIFDGPGTVCF